MDPAGTQAFAVRYVGRETMMHRLGEIARKLEVVAVSKNMPNHSRQAAAQNAQTIRWAIDELQDRGEQ